MCLNYLAGQSNEWSEYVVSRPAISSCQLVLDDTLEPGNSAGSISIDWLVQSISTSKVVPNDAQTSMRPISGSSHFNAVSINYHSWRQVTISRPSKGIAKCCQPINRVIVRKSIATAIDPRRLHYYLQMNWHIAHCTAVLGLGANVTAIKRDENGESMLTVSIDYNYNLFRLGQNSIFLIY